MRSVSKDRRTAPTQGISGVLILLGIAAVTLIRFTPSPDPAESLVNSLSQVQVDGGRFFRSRHVGDNSAIRERLKAAQLLLLSDSQSVLSKRLASLLDALLERLPEAIEAMRKLSETNPQDAEILNDLGVLHLALAEEDATHYFHALALFEQARGLSPAASAPSYNLVVAYRRAGLTHLAESEFLRYQRVERSQFWISELSRPQPTDAQLLAVLRQSLAQGDSEEPVRLLQEYGPRYRNAALRYALAPDAGEPFKEPFDYILTSFRDDRTAEAMLAPLRTSHRDNIITARHLVQQGIEAYRRSRSDESELLYDQAAALIEGADSLFDELWIDINRADQRIRVGGGQQAGALLDEIIERSREHDLKWLLGMALTSKGADSTAVSNYQTLLATLEEAVDTLDLIGAESDTARAWYYMATAFSIAGDHENSLKAAYRSLRLSELGDHLRRAQLYWIAGLQVYRMGFPDYAISLEEQAVAEAALTNNPGLVAFMSQYLAMIHVARPAHGGADDILERARALNREVEGTWERELNDLALNLLCGRTKLDAGALEEAEGCLRSNMDILNRLPIRIPDYYAQTLLQLAELHLQRDRDDLAGEMLSNAIAVVEENDTYLAADTLRMTFENERRKLYETAIGFEFDRAEVTAAWEYLQRYRSKLFLEFLKQRDPSIESLHNVAVERERIQDLIPPTVQVVEHVMLKDRLLVWVVSKDVFLAVAVPVARGEMEKAVEQFIDETQDQVDTRLVASELHRLLIGPIESHLDPNRALAIIPDQALHRLPFAALYSAKDGSYLVERYTILENPNLTSLLSSQSGSPRRAAAVAFGAQTDDTNATVELRELKAFYEDIREFNRADAIKSNFLESLPRANVFHYAGHSQDASDPLRSAILLDGNREGPNSVTALDIAKRRMPSNSVVVLASCDSSVGNSRDGVGMRGLTSAFLISGAGSVVGSLWLVEAQSTSRLVLKFHEAFVEERLPVAEALRKAQLEFIEEGKHPYYWAGFVVTGNLSALR